MCARGPSRLSLLNCWWRWWEREKKRERARVQNRIRIGRVWCWTARVCRRRLCCFVCTEICGRRAYCAFVVRCACCDIWRWCCCCSGLHFDIGVGGPESREREEIGIIATLHSEYMLNELMRWRRHTKATDKSHYSFIPFRSIIYLLYLRNVQMFIANMRRRRSLWFSAERSLFIHARFSVLIAFFFLFSILFSYFHCFNSVTLRIVQFFLVGGWFWCLRQLWTFNLGKMDRIGRCYQAEN